MKHIGVNGFAPVEALAAQLARPIVNVPPCRSVPGHSKATAQACRQSTATADSPTKRAATPRKLLLADDWEALREYGRLLARQTRRVTPYVQAPVSDEQADHDAAVDGREWADD